MITNESELKHALRRLAGSTTQQAPERVEQNLVQHFRRRRQLRARIVWATAIATGAIAAGIAALPMAAPMPGPPAPIVFHAAPPAIQQQATSVVARRAPKKRITVRAGSDTEVATDFYALPDVDSLPPVEDTTVVRVRLPRSAMRMVGLPVNEERMGERIQADVVLGQDGLMRAVRFVQ